MSHLGLQPGIPAAAADESAVVQAIVDHHAELAAGLNQRVGALVDLVEADHLVTAETVRQDLVAYLRREILPHAHAEEEALYPAAAALPEGRHLVEGMLGEHRALIDLVAELATPSTLVRAAAVARAVAAVFATHVNKENDLVLPLLLHAPDVRLATILAGMHDLLGAGSVAAEPGREAGESGCGCGGVCSSNESAVAPAPVLSVDTRLDVRTVPHSQRHALVLSTVEALTPGNAVVLIAGHAPRPVLAEINDRFGAQVHAQWLQEGPEAWQIRLERTTTD